MLRGYSLKNRISIFVLMVLSTLLIGAIGYAYIKINIEGGRASALDSLYWAVVTISTLGYSNNGIYLTSEAGKLFSIFVISMGVFVIFVGVQIGVGPWFEHKLETIMEKRRVAIPKSGHVIVAGLSELGEESMQELISRKIPVVAVDSDESRLRPLIERNIPTILGDPTRVDILSSANISGAKALICTSDDTTNAFVAITAKDMRPDIRVASSASKRSSIKVLKHSGVNSIARSKWISGEMLAARAMGEEETSRKIDEAVFLHHIMVNEKRGMAGMKMSELSSETGMAVAGVRRKGDFHAYTPDMRVKEGDVIILVGPRESLRRDA